MPILPSASAVKDSSGGPGSTDSPDGRKHAILKAALPYLVATIICLVVMGSIYHPWRRNLRIPFDTGGDAYSTQTLVKNFVETGHFYVYPYLGAPGQLEQYDFPMPYWAHFIVLAVLRLFTHDYGLVTNIFFLIAFPFSALTACYALRRLGISSPFAVAGSVLFTFLPIHILRKQHHLFITTLYFIPLLCLTAYWIASGNPLFGFEIAAGSRRRPLITTDGVVALLSCLLIAWDNPYNAFFAVTFLVVGGILGSFRNNHRNAWLTALILSAAVTIAFAIQLVPNWLYQHTHGSTGVGHRLPMESEIFGLTLIQLLAPVELHRISALAHWREYYDSHAIGVLVNENGTASLGLWGAIGFLLSLATLLRKHSSDLLYTLGIFNLWGLLFATIGGFGTIFAFLITPQIRSYNRISMFLGFFSLAALMWALDCAWHSRFWHFRITGLVLVPGLLVLTGVLDQVPRHFLPSHLVVERQFNEQQDFIGRIENTVPQGSMIFQLPYMFFPEHGDLNRMLDYDPLVGYLHSKSLHWSYAALKDRPVDLWQKAVAAEPTARMVDSLEAAGFAGIYVDRYGYTDNAAALEAELRTILKSDPIADSTGRYLFFRIHR